MTVTITQAQSHLAELIAKANAGEQIVITQDEKPIAQLVAAPPEKPKPQCGRGKGMLTIESEDDEHLKDFEEYMPPKGS